MYKAVNKPESIWKYMEALSFYTGAPTSYWEENTSFICVVEAKIVTPRVKNIDINVCFLQEQFGNGLFVPKNEKYGVMAEDICTKLCSGPIISRSTKWMNVLRFYTTSDI